MTLLRVLCVLLGYLAGSIPFAYLAGRLIRGVDIRQYGSRAVTGSNVYENVSRPAVVVVGLLDMGKAALPTWLGLRWGLGLPTGLAAGLAAVVGHNWPLYLGFHGGRGIGSCLGVLTVAFPLGFPWMLVALALGWRLRQPVLPLAGFITLPLFAHLTGQPPAVVWACVAMLLLIVTKRIEANRQPLPEGRERWRTLRRRLLLDRDMDDWETWAHRRPDQSPSEEK
jgi:glycerol-3-phosphate acyltransferase PlsY